MNEAGERRLPADRQSDSGAEVREAALDAVHIPRSSGGHEALGAMVADLAIVVLALIGAWSLAGAVVDLLWR